MKKTLFIYSGEGTQSIETGLTLLKQSSQWLKIEGILSSKLNINLEQIWEEEFGKNRCPYSPLLTAISQICLSDIWNQWGYQPDAVIGHSTGELAAAFQAGFYSLEEILDLAYDIGKAASNLDGVMIHGRLTDSQVENLPVFLSSFNFKIDNDRHVTLSGYADEMEAFLEKHPDFVKMQMPHPWHHPDYIRFSSQLKPVNSNKIEEKNRFVSGVTKNFETSLEKDHWNKWLVSPIDFIQSLDTVKNHYDEYSLDIIEIGFHPVLGQCCKIFRDYRYASSMFRGEDDIKWILFQRKKLDRKIFLDKVGKAVDAVKKQLDFDEPLAYQGLGSIEFAGLSVQLQPYFPSLAPHDFYRYKTITQLIENFGVEKPEELTVDRVFRNNQVVISGMSCRFPSSAETLTRFWDMLMSKQDQVKHETGRGDEEAGFLNNEVTRFDHRYFNIFPAEARSMDPQQILALELTEMLWKDAGIDPQNLDRKRVGVYIGVWNQEYRGDRTSVYYPTGTNPSIIAARISYHYDLRGPGWVSNTACSSSLLAVHYAAKDIEAGRVDYAVAGGVNMLLDEFFTDNMRNSGFLSKDNRCKTFDDSASGYVRAEGGGLVLLANKSLADKYYAELKGSAINQNGGRSQVITAPHPEAQEELITTACRDAGIKPQDISYIECHGTGTKIGDPMEISAIINTIARNRTDTCHLGSVKSNIGHLESAAGIAGLIKSVLALNYGIIPPNLHFNIPNTHINFKDYHLDVVTDATPIDHLANIGISSFGFGGSNAHVIVKGVEESVRKSIRSFDIPFDRGRSEPLDSYLRLMKTGIPETETRKSQIPETEIQESGPDVRKFIQALFFDIVGVKEINPDLELTEQGLDSMSATEFVHLIEEEFKIEIDPDVLFEYPLFDQFVDKISALTGKV